MRRFRRDAARLAAISALMPLAFVAAMLGGSVGARMANAKTFGGASFQGSVDASESQASARSADRFQHARHRNLFPLCSTCHAGITEAGKSIWPEAAQCAACHDGVVKERIAWQPRTAPRPGNLRFTHESHARAVLAKNPADSTSIRDCAACHNERGRSRMAVQVAVVPQCLSCHGLTAPHVDVPSQACATCHIPLTQATGLTAADIARFPKPRSHDAPAFALGAHGSQARGPGPPGTPGAIAASCATCHAQNFCIACHVNAPEVPEIRALATDARAPLFTASLRAPPSHASSTFLRTHGRDAARGTATCATCHTRESCTSCHVGVAPRVVVALPAAGPGRAAGVRTVRRPPPTHTSDFADRHGAEASARPTTCETCHVRTMCLDCHRPLGGSSGDRSVAAAPSTAPNATTRETRVRRNDYHPASFLTRHPASAYGREADCSDCHNPAQFCQSCHRQSGLVAQSRIGQRGYHDAFRGFSLGHGQAARQSLESCVSCHAERDCTACHSAVGGGFRFSPHGPGFDAARLRARNPSLCAACHGRAVPTVR
jgi:hypothetical protein